MTSRPAPQSTEQTPTRTDAPQGREGLLRAAQAGDRRALSELLVQLQPRMRNLVRYLLREDGEVDDLVQEAMVAVVRGLPGYRGAGALESWVDRITARVVFAHIRRRASRDAPRVALRHIPGGERAEVDEYLRRRDLVRALDLLPYEQRAALVLHHVVGMTVPEVARELEAPRETVRSRLRLGMRRLRSVMDAGTGGAA